MVYSVKNGHFKFWFMYNCLKLAFTFVLKLSFLFAVFLKLSVSFAFFLKLSFLFVVFLKLSFLFAVFLKFHLRTFVISIFIFYGRKYTFFFITALFLFADVLSETFFTNVKWSLCGFREYISYGG